MCHSGMSSSLLSPDSAGRVASALNATYASIAATVHKLSCRSYNPVPGRGRIRPVNQQQAMEELSSVVRFHDLSLAVMLISHTGASVHWHIPDTVDSQNLQDFAAHHRVQGGQPLGILPVFGITHACQSAHETVLS